MARARALTARKAPSGSPIVLDRLGEGDLPNEPLLRAVPSALAGLAQRGYSQDEIHDLVVPKRTLARRRGRGEPLSVEETDKALRLDRIASLAARVFADRTKAWDWLRKPKATLDGKTPIAFLGSEAGARVVEDMLMRIDHGILA